MVAYELIQWLIAVSVLIELEWDVDRLAAECGELTIH